MLTSPCTGGARVSFEYQTATLDVAVDAERSSNRKEVTTLLEEVHSDSSLVFNATTLLSTVQSAEEKRTNATISHHIVSGDQYVHRRGAAWIVAGFRLQAILQ